MPFPSAARCGTQLEQALLFMVTLTVLASCQGAVSPPPPTSPRPSTPTPGSPVSGQPGNKIALACHVGDIYIGTVGTGGIVPLTSGPPTDRAPAFSPDMTSIAFVRDDDIWVMASDGSAARDLTPLPGQQMDPAWSPDGSRVAYDAGGGIWIMDQSGSNPHLIPHTNGGVQPSWSPDGKTIVFTSPGHGWSLFTISTTGSDLQLLRQPLNGGLRAKDMTPTWSPDGSHIAFTEVVETRPNGLATQPSGHSAGSPTTYSLYSEAWPQGATTHRSGLRARLLTDYRPISNVFWIRPDGTGFQQLTNDHGLDEHPTWSPDSKQIAYQRYPSPALSPPGKGIKIVNVSTHRSTYFIRGGGCYEPSWG